MKKGRNGLFLLAGAVGLAVYMATRKKQPVTAQGTTAPQATGTPQGPTVNTGVPGGGIVPNSPVQPSGGFPSPGTTTGPITDKQAIRNGLTYGKTVYWGNPQKKGMIVAVDLARFRVIVEEAGTASRYPLPIDSIIKMD